MDTRVVARGAFHVVGKQIRTKNADEASGRGKIAGLWGAFRSENLALSIPRRTAPERVVAVYFDYESDADGPYSLLVGVEVSDLNDVPRGLVGKTIPAGRYAVVTSERGPIPPVVFGVWQKIAGMSAAELGGKRAYRADFEVYDARARDPDDAQIEVNVSIA